MKTHREGPVPPEMGRRLTKGNRQLAAGGSPETVGEGSGHVHRDDRERSAASPAIGNDDEQQLLALLRELVSREGPVKAAEALGVTYRTVMRAVETNTLTRRMEDALKRRQLESGGAVAEPAMRRLEALERRQEEFEAGLLFLAQEVGERLAEVSGDLGGLRDAPARDPSTPAVKGAPQAVIGRPQRVDRPRLGHPAVVTLKPVQDEEFDYGEAMPLPVHGFLGHLIGAACPCRGGVHDGLNTGDEWVERAAAGARSLLVATQGRSGAQAAARRGARRPLARARGDRGDAGAVA